MLCRPGPRPGRLRRLPVQMGLHAASQIDGGMAVVDVLVAVNHESVMEVAAGGESAIYTIRCVKTISGLEVVAKCGTKCVAGLVGRVEHWSLL